MKGILGIRNRTENWKTASALVPLFDNSRAIYLARRLGESQDTPDKEVHAELFWCGVPDWIDNAATQNAKRMLRAEMFKTYRCLFSSLSHEIETYKSLQHPREFSPLREHNYSTSSSSSAELVSNLEGTEVDIVMESPTRLYIGEAKYESSLDTNGNNVLVHQLLRQYIAASVLTKVTCTEKEVIPFLVAEEDLSNRVQVKFMVDQGWMYENHLLTWNSLRELSS